MQLKGTGTFVQALLFFDERNSLEQGPALWAALHEVERFYRRAEPNLSFQRYFISSTVPTISTITSAWRNIGRLLTRQGLEYEYTPDVPQDRERVTATIPPTAVAGPSPKTYDQNKLALEVRRHLNLGASADNLLIVTDRPITPPEGWRYIIWEITSGAGVISTATVDPNYWRDSEPNRIARIKHRTRSAAITITGCQLGLSRCENPGCYMFDDVDSYAVLDLMVELGPEHGIEALSSTGFEADVNDPSVVQVPVVKDRIRARRWR